MGRARAEDLLLADVMRRHVVDIAGPAIEDERPGGVKAGKIGPDGLAVAVDRAVGHGHPDGDRQDAEAEQDQAVAADPRGGQPSPRLQRLPDMSHFAAEMYEYCATLSGAL